jgi:hypothetical protein
VKHFPVGQSTNKGVVNQCSTSAMLNASYGLFAEGPKPLLKEYARCLEQHGITCNILKHQPLAMTNEKQIEARPQMQILLLEDSYFIGEQFVFAKR